MSTIILKVVSSNGVLQPSKTYAPVRSGTPTIKVTAANGAFISYPTDVPTVATQAINDLSLYSTTAEMLANDATTYSNAVNYVQQQGYVNTSQLAANLANFTNTSAMTVASLSDVVVADLSNNATLVYSTANNKYTVKQLDLDGGNF